MPNVDNPSGFLPYNSPHGGNGQATVTEHLVLSTNAEIGVGSPVVIVNGGIDHAGAGAGNPLMGMSAEPKAANAGGSIKVWSDPQQHFVGQTDNGTGSGTSAAEVGQNIDFIGSGVTNRRSTSELDEDSVAVGATVQFNIVELSKEISGNVFNLHGEFNRLVIKINNHQRQGGTGVVGV